MSRRVVMCSILTLPVLVAGCEREPTRIELPDEEAIVHSVLVAGEDTARVLLRHARFDPRSGDMVLEELDVWAVELRDDQARISMDAAPDGVQCVTPQSSTPVVGDAPAQPGCYVARVPGGIRPGAEYELRVFRADGRVVVGRARVPERPEILAPDPAERIPGEWIGTSLSGLGVTGIEWRSGPGTASIGLGGSVATLFLGGEEWAWRGCRVAGSGTRLFDPARVWAEWRLSVWDCFVPEYGSVRPDSVELDLLVFAHDTAYTQYHDAVGWWEETIRRRDVSVNLEGALGLFSGAAPARRRLMLYNADLP